jgi:DHA1 family tetracycline resistance protein-like MFS transporter
MPVAGVLPPRIGGTGRALRISGPLAALALAALPQTLLPVIASSDLDLTPAVIGIALGAGGIVRLAGSAVTGRLSDRVSRKAALVPSLLLMSGSVAILAAPVSVGTWLLTIALLSLASSGIAVAATIIADQVPAGTVGRRLGTFRFTGDLGLLAGPALTGLLYQHAGRAPAMLVTSGVLAACALATGLLVAEPQRTSTAAG